MEFLQAASDTVSFCANIAEIGAGGIAMYLFICKKEEIKNVFKLLITYSFQLSLSELKGKLDKLHDLKAGDKEQHEEIIYIFHDVLGQLRGNADLCHKCEGIIGKIDDCINTPKKMTEGVKRGLVSELREQLRDMDVKTYKQRGNNE